MNADFATADQTELAEMQERINAQVFEDYRQIIQDATTVRQLNGLLESIEQGYISFAPAQRGQIENLIAGKMVALENVNVIQ